MARQTVLPPPWVMLLHRHNGGNPPPKDHTWSDYFDTSGWAAAVTSPSMHFAETGHVVPTDPTWTVE